MVLIMWGLAFILVFLGVVFFYFFLLFTADFFTELNYIFNYYTPPSSKISTSLPSATSGILPPKGIYTFDSKPESCGQSK